MTPSEVATYLAQQVYRGREAAAVRFTRDELHGLLGVAAEMAVEQVGREAPSHAQETVRIRVPKEIYFGRQALETMSTEEILRACDASEGEG